MKRDFLRILCFAAMLTLIAPATAAAYKVTTITRAGFNELDFTGINNAGLVTGTACTALCSAWTGFIYNSQTGVFTDLANPDGAIDSVPYGISDTGVVVVGGYTAGVHVGSFIYEGGHYTDFKLPGAFFTDLRGISADARYLTGSYDILQGFIFDRDTSAFITFADSIVFGINGHGVAAGIYLGREERRAFLYDLASGVRSDYTPYLDRYRDVNDNGIVAGSGLRDGFEQYVAIVGAAGSASALSTYESLNSVATGINNDATVVGYYVRADDTTGAFIATVVPEPGVWALMLCGLPGLAAWRRRADRPPA